MIMTILLISGDVWADKGFHGSPESLPKNLQSTWDSSFRFFARQGNRITQGSSSVIGVKGDTVYFATAYHNIEGICSRRSLCPRGVSMVRGHSLNRHGSLYPVEKQSFQTGRPRVVKASKGLDLAILAVKSPQLAKKVRPIPLSKNCKRSNERLYTIGFPSLQQRSRSKYANQLERKVWSTGVSDHTINGLGTVASVDSIQGSSGGPVLNKKGELVSVIMGSIHNNTGRYYNGRTHSLFTDCQRAVAFFKTHATPPRRSIDILGVEQKILAKKEPTKPKMVKRQPAAFDINNYFDPEWTEPHPSSTVFKTSLSGVQ